MEELQKHNTDSVLGSENAERKNTQNAGLTSPLPNGSKMKLIIETPDGARTELLCMGAQDEPAVPSKNSGFQPNQIPKRMDTIRSEASVQFSLKALNILPPKIKELQISFSKKYAGHNLLETVRQLRQIEKEVGNKINSTGSNCYPAILARLQSETRTLQY